MLGIGKRNFMLLLAQALVRLPDRMQPKANLQLLFLLRQHQKALRLLALLPQGLHARFQLGENILQAHQVFLRLF